MKRTEVFLLLALLVFAIPARATVTFEYIFSGGFPLSCTPDGSVVAGNTTSYGAFRWTQADGLVPLGMDPTPSPGGMPAVSADGTHVAATILSSDGTYSVAGLWTLGSGWTQLPLPPDGHVADAGSTTVYGLSADATTVVGLYWRTAGRGHAFRWTQADGAVDLGSHNGYNASRANVVNADGSVVGGWDEATAGNWRPAAWVNGVETILCADTTGDGQVFGLNPAGTIAVGFDRNSATGTRECARWTRTGSTWSATEHLGVVPGVEPGYGICQSRGVTAHGEMIVGYCTFDGSPYWTTGFVWTQATGTVDVVNWLAENGYAVPSNFSIMDLTAITPNGEWMYGYGRDVVSPYTLRGFRIHNTQPLAVPADPRAATLELSAPRPNPSSGRSELSFTLPQAGRIEVRVFDAAGRLVTTLAEGWMNAGTHAAAWDGRDANGNEVAAGLYWARLLSPAGQATRRIVRVR